MANPSILSSGYWHKNFGTYLAMIEKANEKDGYRDTKTDLKILEKIADSGADKEPSLARCLAADLLLVFI